MFRSIIGERFDGFILGVYQVERLLNTIVPNLPVNYALRLFDGEHEIYRRFDVPDIQEARWGVDAIVDHLGTTWRLRAVPTSEFLARSQSNIPELTLGIGIFAAALITLSLYLAQTARARAHEVEAARHGLEIAIEVRKGVEKDLRDSEQRFRDFGEIASDWFWEMDANHRYVYFSPSVKDVLGVSPESLYGKSREELGANVGPEHWDALGEAIEAHEPYRDLVTDWRTHDGALRWISSNGKPVFDSNGEFYGYRGIGNDITARRRAEERIREQAALLEESNRDLARSNQELDDFAYIVSHGLKEPLRGISNYANFVVEDYGDRLDDKGREMLTTLPRLTVRLGTVIDELLHLSSFGRANLDIEDTDLNGVIENVVDSLKPFLEELAAEIRISQPLPTVSCDSAKVSEVFRNLITNAAKYNDKDQRLIEIGFETNGAGATLANDVSVDKDSVVFYVKDNGIGIPEEHHESVFKIFRRLHARDSFGGGIGAGMTIVKRIVERHGGRIWLESEPGEGSTFYFTLSGGQP